MSTSMRVNVEDMVGLPIFVAAAAVALGILDSTIMGFDLGQNVIELGGGHAFSVANILALLTLGYVAFSNDWSRGDISALQIWLIAATVALVIAPPFLPVLVESIAETPAALVALLIQTGGYVAFSYVG